MEWIKFGSVKLWKNYVVIWKKNRNREKWKKKENYFGVNFNQAGDELKLPKSTLGILNSDDTDAEDDV